MTPIRRRRNPLDRQVLGVYRPPPCARCGKPVRDGRRVCDTDCQPRIVAPKEET